MLPAATGSGVSLFASERSAVGVGVAEILTSKPVAPPWSSRRIWIRWWPPERFGSGKTYSPGNEPPGASAPRMYTPSTQRKRPLSTPMLAWTFVYPGLPAERGQPPAPVVGVLPSESSDGGGQVAVERRVEAAPLEQLVVRS